jgi:hypothetical protein
MTTTNSRNLGLPIDHLTLELAGLPVTDDLLQTAGRMTAILVEPNEGTIKAVCLWDAPCDLQPVAP